MIWICYPKPKNWFQIHSEACDAVDHLMVNSTIFIAKILKFCYPEKNS